MAVIYLSSIHCVSFDDDDNYDDDDDGETAHQLQHETMPSKGNMGLLLSLYCQQIPWNIPNQQRTVSAFSFQGPSVAFSRWLSLLKMYSSLIFLFFKTNPECLGLFKKPQATQTILVKRDKFNVCFGLFIRIVDRERKMRNISRLILILRILFFLDRFQQIYY